MKEDPLLGNVVVLSHGEDLKTYYASLGDVAVSVSDQVAQGDKLGTAGKNLFGKDNGTHLHFEIRKDGTEVNPESYFEQPASSIAVEDSAAEDEAVSEEPTSGEDVVEPEEDAEENVEQDEAPSEDEEIDVELDESEE